METVDVERFNIATNCCVSTVDDSCCDQLRDSGFVLSVSSSLSFVHSKGILGQAEFWAPAIFGAMKGQGSKR